MGMKIVLAILVLGSIFYLGFSMYEDFLEGDSNGTDVSQDGYISREDAEDIAMEAVRSSYEYVQFNGANLDRTDHARGRGNIRIFEFEFSVSTEDLPSDITRYSYTVRIDGEEVINETAEPIRD